MKKAALLLLAVSITGCTNLYSNAGTWQKDPQAPVYQFTGKMGLGTGGRKITIYANGRQLMKQSARYWANRITMTATLDGQPVTAECQEKPITCEIIVGVDHVATLTF